MRRIVLAAAIVFASVANLWAQGSGQLPAWNVLGNPSAGASNARSASLNAMFNGAFCSTANTIVARVGGSWVCQGLGTGLSFSAGNLTVAPPWLSITGTPTTLSGYGITSPLPYAQGGCNATTQAGCTNNIFPTPTRAGDIVYWNGSTWVTLPGNNSGTQVLQETSAGVPSWAASAAASATLVAPQGRLTLQTHVPVMSTSQTNISAIFYDSYVGNVVYYWNGSADTADIIPGNEASTPLILAASAGQVVANNVYDVWWVHGGANRICLAMNSAVGGGGGWSSDTAGSNTARGTGYSQLDRTTRPYITNANSITNCFNGSTNYGPVSANQGTYLGTVYANANGQVSYTFGGAASGGTAALFGVWNAYNRVAVNTTVNDTVASYSYTSATVRSLNGSNGNRVTFVNGLVEEGISASLSLYVTTASVINTFYNIGFGQDSTTTYAGSGCSAGIMVNPISTNAASLSLGANCSYQPGLGLHFLQAIENADGTNAATLRGLSGGIQYEALTAQLRM